MGDLMKNLGIAFVALFLLVAGGFYIKKYQGIAETTAMIQEVKWDIKKGKENKKVDLAFQLFNKKSNAIRGVNDQLRAVVVDENLGEIQEVKPIFIGSGSYKITQKIEKSKEYTVFLYEDHNKTESSFSKKNFGEKNKNKPKGLVGDTILTKKIGDHQVSLLFGALHPNEAATLTFQFQAKKGEKLKIGSHRGVKSTLSIVDEEREHFIYGVPFHVEEQLQYRITFPQEGTYKIWGTFYLNDKKYKQEFIVQVQKRKNS